MRETFSAQLVDLVKHQSNVYLLSGDHGYALFDALRKEKNEHFINAGVAEQNMVGVGAGLSKLGFYPIMYGLSAFVPVRVLEQIKIDFCYENLPGLFIGDGAGVVYGHLGTSHQCTEDIAALRALPKLSILSPCDALELEACFKWAVQQKNPVYLRMGKADLGAVHSVVPKLGFSPLPITEGSGKTAVLATGSMVKPALDVLRREKLAVDLYSVPMLKGPQAIELNSVLSRYQRVLTVEEHSIYGGLGDLVAAEAVNLGVPVRKVGIQDKFSELCGAYEFLIREHGLDQESLSRQIKEYLG